MQKPVQTGNNWELVVERPGKLAKLKRPPDVPHWIPRAYVYLLADGTPAAIAVCSRQAAPVRAIAFRDRQTAVVARSYVAMRAKSVLRLFTCACKPSSCSRVMEVRHNSMAIFCHDL